MAKEQTEPIESTLDSEDRGDFDAKWFGLLGLLKFVQLSSTANGESSASEEKQSEVTTQTIGRGKGKGGRG